MKVSPAPCPTWRRRPKPVAKPVDVASLPEIKLRAGSYANFTRLVFDWPKDVSYQVFPGAGKMTIKFNALARADVSAIARFAPPWVKNAAWRIDGGSTIVEFETDSDSGFHDFKDGTHVVLDVLAPKTDSTAYAPPGIAKPTVTKMAPAESSAKHGARASRAATPAPKARPPAQAQEVAKTVAALTPAKPDAKKPDAQSRTRKAATPRPPTRNRPTHADSRPPPRPMPPRCRWPMAAAPRTAC